MKTKNRIKHDEIHGVLDVLTEAAEEKKEQVFGLIKDKYVNLKDVLTNASNNGKAAVKQAKKHAIQLDKKVHKDPWIFLGGVALSSLIFGLMLGRKR
jgi:ElaB/YqjD/DUF883 family membrane-anchored ribosome-binding protein